MNFLLFISDYIMPLLIFYIVGFALISRTNMFDDFVDGAKDGFKIVCGILPTLIGLMLAIGCLRSSGCLEMISGFIRPLASFLHFPSELVPLVTVKMFSSSAATGLLLDIYKEYGTDSANGILASILMSCSETIFYTMSVYFVVAKVTKTRWTLPGALVATFAGVVASVLIMRWI